MKASLLYLITAIVTGIFVFYLASATIWGAPRNPLHYVSFFGSLVLVTAAFVAPFRPRAAAIVAFVGSGLAWCFFAPAIIYSALMPFTFWLDMKENISFHDYVPVMGPLLCPALLIASTVYAIYQLRDSQQ